MNFELIIPSLPGFGFSERAHKTGLGAPQIAQIFLKLMKRVGHEKFYVQGGDWGSIVAADMAVMYPKNVVGMHLNMCASHHSRYHIRILLASIYPTLFMEQDEADRIYPLSNHLSNMIEESGYFHSQTTKPDTVGVGLSNCPSGLAAYILEKFSTATNINWRKEKDGGLPYFDIMIYWLTNSITSSVRIYSEAFTHVQRARNFINAPVKIPTGCLASPNELLGQENGCFKINSQILYITPNQIKEVTFLHLKFHKFCPMIFSNSSITWKQVD